jgi:hypothetical protein
VTAIEADEAPTSPTALISRELAAMDAPESPAPAVAATFAQKTWLRRLLSRIRPSWGSPRDRNTPFSYQVVMPDATSSGRDGR